MSFKKIKMVYFLGIGGIGMSALARYFKSLNKMVAGYDKTATDLTKQLILEGIEVNYEDDEKAIPDEVRRSDPESLLVIYTPAIPADNRQYRHFINNAYRLHKRSAVLGMITEGTFTIAVAGTHGKTTTSAIIAYILKQTGFNCTAFLGGISVNYNTNFIEGNAGANDSVIVVEADEFDRSFLSLHPDIAVITSMDADHLDIYEDKRHLEESYRMFAGQVKAGGTLISRKQLPLSGKSRHYTYSITEEADYHTTSVTIRDARYVFQVDARGKLTGECTLGMPGRHNVENAVAAIAATLTAGADAEKAVQALADFKGVKRRFEYHIREGECIYIDDYAHHPEELRAVITSVKELYPERRVTGIFQPHLYSRSRDFADGFASSLSLLDSLILMDIYPARELPIPGVDSGLIYNKVTIEDKVMCSREAVIAEVKKRRPALLLTLGAGDIDLLVEPIKEALT